MKTKNKGFPSSDEKFNIAYNQLMDHLAVADLSSNQPTVLSWQRLGLDNVTEYTVLSTKLGDVNTVGTWNYVFPLEKHRATHNSTFTGQKNTLKKFCLVIIRALRMALRANSIRLF